MGGGQDWEKAEVLKACLAISLHPIDADALNNFLFRSVQFIPLLFKQLILNWLALDPSSEGKQSYIFGGILIQDQESGPEEERNGTFCV